MTEIAESTTCPTVAPEDFAGQYVATFVDRWDDLIDWDARRKGEGAFFAETLHRDGARTVLDAASGTGYHSVALSQAGFTVTAADGSAEMIRRTRANARTSGQEFTTHVADWRTLATTLSGQKFDAVVCLGSSFPHLFDEDDRRTTLQQFSALLKPGGLLFIDHRNFDAIRAHQYRSSGRYYYCGQQATVTVDHVDSSLCRFRYEFTDQASYTLEVYPLLADEMTGLLADEGFDQVQRIGDFIPGLDLTEADFVIHVARKSHHE